MAKRSLKAPYGHPQAAEDTPYSGAPVRFIRPTVNGRRVNSTVELFLSDARACDEARRVLRKEVAAPRWAPRPRQGEWRWIAST